MRNRRRPGVVPRLVFSVTFAGVVPICFAAGACGGNSGAGTNQTDAETSPKDGCVSETGTCSDGNMVCDGTTCQACGSAGQPCCNGDKCTGGCCNTSATPSVCVATGSVCPELEGAVGTAVCSSAGFCAPCGGDNGPCCPTGAACQAGCCDPTAKSCVNPGASCSGSTAVCSGTTCEPCGGAGQPCCASSKCSSGCCDTSATAMPGNCVAAGGACAPNGTIMRTCPPSGGSCESCGADGDPCCPGNTCTLSNEVCATVGGTLQCTQCGIPGDPCCAGATCSVGTCTAGKCM